MQLTHAGKGTGIAQKYCKANKKTHNDLRQKIRFETHIDDLNLQSKSQGESLFWEIRASKGAHAY